MRRSLLTIGLFAATVLPVLAAPPPPGAKPLSEIMRMVEQQPEFHYIEDVDFKRGVYDIKFYSKDGVRRRLYINPTTGEPSWIGRPVR